MSISGPDYSGYKCVHEGCQKSFEPRKGGNNVHRQRNCGKPFGRQNIMRCATDAESPKLHLQHIVDAAHQGEHHQDLRKQELQIIANIKEKCELYLRNIVHFAAASPRESNGALLKSWAATPDVAFILKWQPARRTGPTQTSGGHRWRVALTAVPGRRGRAAAYGGRLERAHGRHAGGAADIPTARWRRGPIDGSPDRQGRPSSHLR